jgi:uridylate kinase
VIVPDTIDTAFLNGFREMILASVKEDERFVIICGGGKTCRRYQQALREITDADDESLDHVGIASSKLNAELVKQMFKGHAYGSVLHDPFVEPETDKPIIIGAGFRPGSSTDLRAVQIAATMGASRVINISNIDYVYDKDPARFKDAKKYKTMTWDQFLGIFDERWVPGSNVPFDPIAAKYANEKGILVCIVSKDLDNLKYVLDSSPFKGTSITP